MKKFFTLLSVVSLYALNTFAQTYNGGTWYSVYDSSEKSNVVITSDIKSWDVFSPATGTVTFDYKKYTYISTNGNVEVHTSTDGSNYSKVGNVGYSSTSYNSGSVNGISANIKKMKFVNTGTGVSVKNIKLPLAKHILLSGDEYGKSSVTKTYPNKVRVGENANIRADFRSFLTAGNISISLTAGDPEVFRLGSSDNTTGTLASSTAGKTYAVGSNACASANGTAAACANGQLAKIDNYSFQIYFCPKAVTDYTGTITITDGTSTATIKLNGTGIKMETLEVPVALSFCEGGSAEFRGKTYTSATSENIEAVGAIRDTVYAVTVTENHPTSSTEEKTITFGDAEEWNGINLSDSTVGVHTVVFGTTNAAGCDSTVTLTLTVNKQETLEVPVALSFCEGGSAEFRGVEYTEAGVTNVPATGDVRDTTYVVTVTVLEPTSSTEEKTITFGDAEVWNGINLSDSTVGVHTVVFGTTNAAGCDSTVTLTLTVNKQETLEVPVALSFCEGGSAEFRGVEYTEAGVTNVPATGDVRDTTYVVTVTVLEPTSSTEEKTITFGDAEEWNGINLSDSTVGVHTVVFGTTNAAGCDSTVTLTLTVNKQETLEVPVALSFCEGGSAEFRGVEYTEAGVTNVPATGDVRDTTYVVTVTVLEPTSSTEEKTITFGDAEVWNGINLSDSTVGVHTVVFGTTNAAGCDSTVTLTLTVNKQETLEVPVALSFCEGDSVEYGGKWYLEAGEDAILAEGDVRDTLYTLTITVNNPDLTELFALETVGEYFVLPEGVWYLRDSEEIVTEWTATKADTSGLWFVEYLKNSNGCDSITKFFVDIKLLEAVEMEPVLLGFCPGDSVEYRGKWYTTSVEDTLYIEDAIRDTLIYVTAVVLPEDLVVLNSDSLHVGEKLVLGEGEWYKDGELLTEPEYMQSEVGEFDIIQTLDNEFGCDSVVVRHVVVEEAKTPTGLKTVEGKQTAVKELRNGVIYIRRGEGLYTTDGKRIK